MGRLPSYRDFTPLLGTMRLPGIPYSPSFELSRQKNPQPADSVRRSEKKRPSEGSRRMALSGPKMLARPEYVPLWNSELSVWRSGFAGFLSPLARSVANPMRTPADGLEGVPIIGRYTPRVDCADAKTTELIHRFGVVSPRSTLAPNTCTQSVALLMS